MNNPLKQKNPSDLNQLQTGFALVTQYFCLFSLAVTFMDTTQ